MRIAIIDGVNQDIGLKILYPDADYFIKDSEINRDDSYNHYNFQPKKDWSVINDQNYDILFVVIALWDSFPGKDQYQQKVYDILSEILHIVDNNNFKTVAIFDNYDYDYDPNIIINNKKINIFFKRNYNLTKIYNDNVRPFPFIMFGQKSLIEKCDRELVTETDYFKEKIDRIFFTGGIYKHNDYKNGVIRDREAIYNELRETIYNSGYIPYNSFIDIMRNSKYGLDLLGVGDPNLKTFEILLSGALMISEVSTLNWPFPDKFSEETIFTNKDNYFVKIKNLKNDNELFIKCLKNQYNIVKKYFNKDWIRSYIENNKN